VNAPDESEAREAPRRRIRPLAWVGIGVVLLVVLIVAGVAWILNTEGGAQFAANRAVGFLDGKLEVGEVHGTIAGPLTVGGIRWFDKESGVDVHVARVALDVALSELWSKRAHVQFLDVNGVNVRLFEHPPKPEEPSNFTLKPPLDIVLDRLTVKDVQVVKDDKPLFVARTAEAAASWTSRGVAIQKFIVDSPDGNVHLVANVSEENSSVPLAQRLAPNGAYAGKATGGFRWKVGELEYAGDLVATSQKEQLVLNLQMRAPVSARLDATLGETKALPWTFTLAVPTFDPRKTLMPDGSLASLAANLRGQGDLTVAEVRGDASINGQSVHIDPARVSYQNDTLKIEELTLIDPSGRGTLNATGDVRFGGTEPNANLLVQWKDVNLPKEWVGQPIASHGEIKVVGSPSTFTADGNLAAGPPGHLADVVLAIAGTPEQIEFKQLAITERTGNLSATGTVQLKPAIGWTFNAKADRFDPGQFLVDWPGQLGFTLDTRGKVTPEGPDASFDLKDLQGKLRGRALAGQAALTINPQKVIAGNLNLRSGKSSLTLNGDSGTSMNVNTGFDIASLDDWVPKSSGRLNGKFHITGKWPLLAVEGGAQGRDVVWTEYSVKALDVTADMKNPQSPEGSLKVTASDIIAAGFTFSNTELVASGNEKDHSLQLTANGQPLTAQLKLHGARDKDAWSGTIDQLMLAAVGIEPLSLRQPTQVNVSPRGFSISESCLAGEQIAACVTANQNEAGELNAKYRLEHLPLGLIAALAAPDLPLRIEAVIEGEGNIRRTKDGALFGDAQVTSTSGRISEASAAPQEDAADALLTYENLRLEARLMGDEANGSISTSLNKGGTLEGTVAASNLSGSSPALNGHVKLAIPDLSPVGLFVPQLADVKGRGEAELDIEGTVKDPQITGTAALTQLSAEVPQVGIKLHDGEMHAALAEGNAITVNGKVGSGDGQITLNGDTDSQGVLKVKIQGKDFMAANIPGAKVLIAPDLDFQRNPEKMTLGGSVTIPKADIDLTKLPKQGASVQRASSDVVVIDDEDSDVVKSRSTPLEAHVKVILGKDVNLVGYGLTSKVEGELVVHELPEEETTATGEVRVSGKYKAYGQDLTIEQGRLLYAGQAITDPQVNIIATRTVESVTAKLIVSGSAQKPLLEVTSDPPLPQTQALSYLVAGKPISEVGAGEGDMVQSAARSLGGAAGNLLAKNLGKRLGIDEIGIEDTPEAGGSAFTVGQYLSPRLYLSYGVGLFEPGQVVTLRYRINDKLSLEAVQGTLSQRAGINYRVEKR
jgi:translocation and assembly module TamB